MSTWYKVIRSANIHVKLSDTSSNSQLEFDDDSPFFRSQINDFTHFWFLVQNSLSFLNMKSQIWDFFLEQQLTTISIRNFVPIWVDLSPWSNILPSDRYDTSCIWKIVCTSYFHFHSSHAGTNWFFLQYETNLLLQNFTQKKFYWSWVIASSIYTHVIYHLSEEIYLTLCWNLGTMLTYVNTLDILYSPISSDLSK